MKNKFWILMAIAAFALASCGDDDKNNGGNNNGNDIITPPLPELHGAPYDHLGIGEPKGADCGDNCAYKNYNTSTGENAFPKPIYRVGANADGYGDAEIQAAANKIISAYGNNTNGIIKMDIKDVDHFKAILTQSAQIVSGNGAYSLDSGTLKISVNGSADIVEFLKDKALHDHLGIDEAKCTASAGCELKDYNTSTGDIETKFPVPIYRYGQLSNFGELPFTMLTDTVSNILATYALPSDGSVTLSSVTKAGKEGLTNDKRLDSVQIFNNPNWGQSGVFWEGKVLGLQAKLDSNKDAYIYMYLGQIGEGLLQDNAIPKTVTQ